MNYTVTDYRATLEYIIKKNNPVTLAELFGFMVNELNLSKKGALILCDKVMENPIIDYITCNKITVRQTCL